MSFANVLAHAAHGRPRSRSSFLPAPETTYRPSQMPDTAPAASGIRYTAQAARSVPRPAPGPARPFPWMTCTK